MTDWEQLEQRLNELQDLILLGLPDDCRDKQAVGAYLQYAERRLGPGVTLKQQGDLWYAEHERWDRVAALDPIAALRGLLASVGER